MSGIFGGSKSKSTSQQSSQSTSYNKSASWNDAYDDIRKDFGGYTQSGLRANDFLSRLLGMQGSDEALGAFDQYKKSAGYDFIMDQGLKAIDGSAAGRGMIGSGAAMKEALKYGQGTASQFYNNFLDRLLGMSGQGLQAGGLISAAGQKSFSDGYSQSTSQGTSQSTSKSNNGMGNFLGSLLASVAGG